MKATERKAERRGSEATEKVFAMLAGGWLGLSLLKFGNPIILDQMVAAPTTPTEFLIQPWPVAWGYLIGAGVILSALPLLKIRWEKQYWPAALLLFWFLWVLFSNAQTVSTRLSYPTLLHFSFCVLSFLIGLFAFSRVNQPKYFWIPLILCFGYVLFNAFDQKNGGLDEMRKAFYEQPDWQTYPKEFLLKLSTNRIFSTLVYPNALAGAILLFLPILLWELWQVTARWNRIARAVVAGLYGYLGLTALYWTGSKGGWLIAILILGAILLRLSFSRRTKIALLSAALCFGLAAFAVKFSGYFKKGAPSVGARFVYWQAAWKIATEHPLLGTGPGTFQVPFKAIKPPDAEMARLVHNDYLEQASDSGFPAFGAYLGFVFGSLVALYRYSKAYLGQYLLWTGLLGWSAQSFIEFGLFIPALSWPTFFFFGWLLGRIPGSERERGRSGRNQAS